VNFKCYIGTRLSQINIKTEQLITYIISFFDKKGSIYILIIFQECLSFNVFGKTTYKNILQSLIIAHFNFEGLLLDLVKWQVLLNIFLSLPVGMVKIPELKRQKAALSLSKG
jgi:hypothetical protein